LNPIPTTEEGAI